MIVHSGQSIRHRKSILQRQRFFPIESNQFSVADPFSIKSLFMPSFYIYLGSYVSFFSIKPSLFMVSRGCENNSEFRHKSGAFIVANCITFVYNLVKLKCLHIQRKNVNLLRIANIHINEGDERIDAFLIGKGATI